MLPNKTVNLHPEGKTTRLPKQITPVNSYRFLNAYVTNGAKPQRPLHSSLAKTQNLRFEASFMITNFCSNISI